MRCWHCGHVFTPATVDGKAVQAVCPGCGSKLGLFTPPKKNPIVETKAVPTLPIADLEPPVPPPSPPDKQRALANAVMLVSGILFLFASGIMGIYSYDVMTNYERTQGGLINKQKVRNGRSVSYIGTVAFTAHDGQTYHLQLRGVRSMQVGASVRVFYRRDNPNDSRVDSTNALWGFPFAFGGIGCVLMVIWMVAPGGSPLPPLTRRKIVV
jgi:hypothetical protein